IVCFSSRRRHTRSKRDWSSDVCSSDLKFGGTTGQLLVRTPASLAFGLLRQGASSRGEPTPTLITGPEQDQILAELIAGHLADGRSEERRVGQERRSLRRPGRDTKRGAD